MLQALKQVDFDFARNTVTLRDHLRRVWLVSRKWWGTP